MKVEVVCDRGTAARLRVIVRIKDRVRVRVTVQG